METEDQISYTIPYNQDYENSRIVNKKKVSIFKVPNQNIDLKTVDSFGEEWDKFDTFDADEIEKIGNEYFDIVPNSILKKESTRVIDLGCGSGRWSIYISPKVLSVEAIDPSKAIFSAAKFANDIPNIRFTQASVDNIPFPNESFDFGVCLGVLHHIPNTQQALNNLGAKIKENGHLLLYLYYALDNRSYLYKAIFHCSTFFRNIVSRLPNGFKKLVCDLIAIIVYLPFIGLAWLTKLIFRGDFYKNIPLNYYMGKSFKVIRNDSLDRFGTPLEQRFTKEEITSMLYSAGFENLIFSDRMPYWHVLAQKKSKCE